MDREEKMHVLTGGVILITLGVLLLLSNLEVCSMAKSWPLLLWVVGALTIIRKAKDIGGWIITVTGVVFLMQQNISALQNISNYALPLIVILLGCYVIMKKKKRL